MHEPADSGSGGGDGDVDTGDDEPTNTTDYDDIPGLLSGQTRKILKAFAADPRRFILGVVLTSILEGFFGLVSEVLSYVQLFLGGSSPTQSFPEEHVWGIADIVAALFRILGTTGLDIGSTVIRAVQGLNNPLYELAGSAGPAAPLAIAIFLSVEVVAVLLLLEYTVRVLADFVPGLGGFV